MYDVEDDITQLSKHLSRSLADIMAKLLSPQLGAHGSTKWMFKSTSTSRL